MDTIDARDDLPRVSVDSIQDWNRIKENFQRAALATLDSKLAARGLSGQREAYIGHILQFVDRTFEIAKPNVRVNGKNLEECDQSEDDADAYDEALDRHVWSLSDARRKWDLEVAKKRRALPLQTEQLMQDLIARQREADQEVNGDDDDDGNDETNSLGDEAMHNSETPAELLRTILNLKGEIPLQIQRSERVKEVTAEIRLLKP